VNISYSSFYAYSIFSLIFSRFSNGEKMYTSAKKTGAGESTRSCRKIVVKRQVKSCYLRAMFTVMEKNAQVKSGAKH